MPNKTRQKRYFATILDLERLNTIPMYLCLLKCQAFEEPDCHRARTQTDQRGSGGPEHRRTSGGLVTDQLGLVGPEHRRTSRGLVTDQLGLVVWWSGGLGAQAADSARA